MNIFVAGISLSSLFNKLSPKTKCQDLSNLFPTIIAEAVKTFDQDVITVIVLEEYALTHKPITNTVKKELINLLHQSIKHYKNAILIPGSFAAYQPLVETPHKANKIAANYRHHYYDDLYDDDKFQEEFCQYSDRMKKPLHEILYLENSSYLLTNKDKIKHKKTCPWKERNKLFGAYKNSSIFYIGTDRTPKNITLEQENLIIDLSICREHSFYNNSLSPINAFPIDVIISAWISPYQENFKGALSIHMDSKTGLTVYVNTAHPEMKRNIEIKAMHYTKNTRKTPDQMKSIDIIEYQAAIPDHSLTNNKNAK